MSLPYVVSSGLNPLSHLHQSSQIKMADDKAQSETVASLSITVDFSYVKPDPNSLYSLRRAGAA